MNDEIDKYNILYKPKIEYDKKYDSIGNIENKKINNKYEENSNNTDLNDINSVIDKIDEIKNALPLMPSDIKKIVKTPLDIIEIVIGDLPGTVTPPKENEEDISIGIKNPEPDSDDKNIYPEDPFSDIGLDIKITIEEEDKVKTIKDEYVYDLSSVFADYINKLNKITNTYLESILVSFGKNEVSNFEQLLYIYSGSSKDVETNYKHLSDSIIRSQISRGMKERFYLKMFDIDETISHIRKCKAGVEQRIRYYESNYEKSTSYNSLMNDKLLGQNRVIFDRKYKENFINLYKYLNSSIVVLNECVSMVITEMQAKVILLEKEK